MKEREISPERSPTGTRETQETDHREEAILVAFLTDLGEALRGQRYRRELFSVTGPEHAIGEAIRTLLYYREHRISRDLLQAVIWIFLLWRGTVGRNLPDLPTQGTGAGEQPLPETPKREKETPNPEKTPGRGPQRNWAFSLISRLRDLRV